MKCVNCGKYVERHNLKDAQICLELCSQKIIGMTEKNKKLFDEWMVKNES